MIACGKPGIVSGSDEDVECGGTVDSSFDAPKTIESKDIVKLSLDCYIYGYYGSDDGGNYDFTLTKNDDGSAHLAVSGVFDAEDDVAPDVPASAQAIIDKYGLVKKNGTDSYTAGLPPEFQPMHMSVEYASGEKLYFCENNDPDSEWTSEYLKLFKDALIAAGHDELLPPPEEREITRCHIEFNYEGLNYEYAELIVGTDNEVEIDESDKSTYEVKYFRYVWDLATNEEVSDEIIDLPDGVYEGIQEIVEAQDLQKYDNRRIKPFDFHSAEDDYFSLYIEYASGRRLEFFERGSGTVEKYAAVREALTEYLDPFFESGN